MRLPSNLFSIGAVILGFTAALGREQQQPSLRRSNLVSDENQKHSIEPREVEPGLFSISFTQATNYNDVESRRLSPALLEYRQCILYLEDVYYFAKDNKDVEGKWVCVIQNYISDNSGVHPPHAFDVTGGGEKFEQFLKEEAISAQYILRWDGEAVTLNEYDEHENVLRLKFDISEDRDSLWIEKIEEDKSDETNGRRLRLRSQVTTKGVKKTLVIRIVGGGVGPSPSLSELREEVFGTERSLKSQMEACSHGQLVIEPFTGRTNGAFQQQIIGGVVEIGIGTNPYGKSDKWMENEVAYASWYVFGDLEQQFDLVIFSMPPGIVPPYAAYAYAMTPFSFYSNNAIRDMMIVMHEVGHNLGLEHSGEGEEEYGDASGYMGYSEVMEPRMCYNAVNNYQLDWYSKLSIKPTSADGFGGSFVISGVDGYDPNDTTKFVTLRLEQENFPGDYYVGYNRAEGINAETQEDGDKVIIFLKDGDVHESKTSWKKAALEPGESFVIVNFNNSGRSVTVTFSNIESNAAVVEITPETSESPTLSPRPSGSPTISPTVDLSPSPSSDPTASPSVSSSTTPSITSSFMPSILETATSTFFTTTGTSTVTTFTGTTPTMANLTANSTANATTFGTICDDDLFLKINIRTDYFPEETWWILKMIGGEEIDRLNPSSYQTQLLNYTVSIFFRNCVTI